jgi:hypothetical protein
MIPLRATIPEHREQAHQGAQRQHATTDPGRDHATHQRDGQGQERPDRQAPVAERGLQQQQHPDRRGDREQQQAVLCGRALGVLPERLCPELQRPVGPGQLGLEVVHDGPEVTRAVEVRPDVDLASEVLVVDDVRSGDDLDRRHVLQRHPAARRRVDDQVADVGEVPSHVRGAPQLHVAGATCPEQVPGLLPGKG